MPEQPISPRQRPALHHTLAFRQVRYTVVFALLLGLVFSFVQIYLDYLSQRKAIAESLQHQAEVMSKPASDALWYLNGDLATGVIDGVFGNKSVVEGRIITVSGYPLAVRWRNIPEQPYAWLTEELFGREQRIEKELFYDPDNLEQRRIGKLIVVADPTVAGLDFLSRAATLLLSGLFKNLVLAFSLLIVFYYTCTRSLVEMAQFLGAVDPAGPRNQHLAIPRSHRRDEIGLVSRMLNALIDSVASHRQERDVLEAALVSNNENLEKTVAQRTAELERTVFKLKQQSSYVQLLGQVASIANIEPDPAIALRETLALLMRLYNAPVGTVELFGSWAEGKHTRAFWLQYRNAETVDQPQQLQQPPYLYYVDMTQEQPYHNTAALVGIVPVRVDETILTQGSRHAGRRGADEEIDALLIVPVVLNGEVVARMVMFLSCIGAVAEETEEMLSHVGDQLSRVFERQQNKRKLLDLALTDPLTGVLNRRAMEERVNDEYRLSVRHQRQLAFILFDIDNFKNINDTYGHPGGDQVLIQLTKQVRQQLRESDIFGRMGGEEFAVVLPECHLYKAIEVAERMREAVKQQQVSYCDQLIQVSLSIGVAMLDDADDSYADAMGRADDALYQAKYAGKNCSWFYLSDEEGPQPVAQAARLVE